MSKTFFFHGKRHDHKILKVKILLSRNFVVMAQAPKIDLGSGRRGFGAESRPEPLRQPDVVLCSKRELS